MTTNQAVETTGQNFRITLWHVSLVLVLIGVLVSGYISYTTATRVETVCLESGAFNCDAVQSSAYSKIFGIPIAYLGLLTYLIIGGLLLFQYRIPFLREFGGMLIFGIVLFAFIYSIYLVYLQVAVLQSLCQWCLIHEVTMTILFIVTCFRLKNELTSPIQSS
jgi:uncharacterized membrane protein